MGRIHWDVPLVPQAGSRTCWYAAAQMVLAWRDARLGRQQPPGVPVLDSLADEAVHKANQRISILDIFTFAQSVGLRTTHGPLQGHNLVLRLAYNGPLIYSDRVNGWGNWVSYVGSGHCIVLTGCESDGGSIRVWFNDPSPSKLGRRGVVPLTQLEAELPWNAFPLLHA